MPNIASAFKDEMSRVARRELRSETQALKKAVGMHRWELAALKRRTQALERELRRIANLMQKAAPLPPVAVEEVPVQRRFSAERLAAHRQRLGLSAADFGLLLGASAQSIYNWEAGTVRPLPKHLVAIGGLRKLGKREAVDRVQSFKSS
jgi:DNA-binding transcriptional regulator YiaG